jgi:hypothetical protein
MDDVAGTTFNLKGARNHPIADDALDLDRHVKFSGSGRVVAVADKEHRGHRIRVVDIQVLDCDVT